MGDFTFRKPLELTAWSGNVDHLQKLLTVIYTAFDSEKNSAQQRVISKAQKEISGLDDRTDYQDLIAKWTKQAEDRRESELQAIGETFKLRANIDVSKAEITTTGTPEEIIDELDERVRQDLRVRCPGHLGSLRTEKSITLSMKSKYGVSIGIEGDDRNWVVGMHDRLLEEVTKQSAPDRWLISWWARTLVVLATCSIVAAIASTLPVSIDLKIAFILGVGFWASTFANGRIDQINRFELVAPGKSARSAKTWAVVTYLISSVVLPLVIYLLTKP